MKIPVYKKYELNDQLDVVLLEDSKVPLFHFRLVICCGSVLDPEGKEGLTRAAAGIMKRGAGKYSANKFFEAVEFTGGSINVQTGYEDVIISGDFLSKDIEFCLELLATMLFEPKFLNSEINYYKKRTISQIQSLKDNPSGFCNIVHKKNLFQDNPYGRPIIGYEKTVRNINRKNITDMHQNVLLKSKFILTLAGDFENDKILRTLNSLFTAKYVTPTVKIDKFRPPKLSERKIYIFDKPDQSQSQIRIGNLGLIRNSPNFHKLQVTNTIFGGSFTSRLMTEVRVKKGLTYGIRSLVNSYKNTGSINISTFTKNETVSETVNIIFKEIEKLQNKNVTKKELSGVQKYMTGLFPLSIETLKGISGQLSNIYFYGLPKNSIEKYTENIYSVTDSNVNDMAGKYYSSKNSVITVLGRKDDIIKNLEKIGDVSVIDQ
ncbi:M16 family metallopeptidase [candidate division KSB1 bacterium]